MNKLIRSVIEYTKPHSQLEKHYLADLMRWRSGESRDYQRFLVLASPRSGSSWLVDLLRDYAALCVYGEIFNPNRIFAHPTLQSSTSNKILAARDLFPARFARTYIFRGYKRETKAVGFKIFYNDLERFGMDRLWSYLMSERRLKVIHLQRRNLLRALISEKIAQATGNWRGGQSKTIIMLTQNECEAYFEKIMAYRKKYADRLKGHDALEVHYEDLTEAVADEMARALEFLGVDPIDLHSTVRKQEYRPMTRSVSNYVELKSQMAGSGYGHFFVD